MVTAAADSLAGWLLATGSVAGPSAGFPWPRRRWSCTRRARRSTTSSTSRSTAPSGPAGLCRRAGSRGAPPPGSAGWALARAGLALPSGSAASGIVAAVLALCILAYDAGLKHTWLGPVFMGACRGLNLLLGMSHAAALAGPIGWFAAAAYGLFVAGITVVSRSETTGGARGGLVAGLVLQDLALVGLAGVALAHQRFPNPTPTAAHPAGGPARSRAGRTGRQLERPRGHRAADPPAHSKERQDRHPRPWSGCTSAWSPPCGAPSRRPWSRSLGAGFLAGPMALFDVSQHHAAVADSTTG